MHKCRKARRQSERTNECVGERASDLLGKGPWEKLIIRLRVKARLGKPSEETEGPSDDGRKRC